MKHHLHLLLAASFGAMPIGAAAAVHDWTATRIGPFEADSLQIADMNNTGQVALWAEIGLPGEGSAFSFLYTPGSSGGPVNLGSLGGARTVPTALNASGQVVGSSYPAVTSTPQQAFIYQNGRMQRLGLPGETSGQAVGINDRGQVLVGSTGADSISRAAIFHPAGPPIVLSVPGRTFVPNGGINNRGQVYGPWFSPTAQDTRTFFYDNGRMTDIGSLGGGYTVPHDMNASGQIVGSSSLAGPVPPYSYPDRPFRYSDGKMTQIGTFDNFASAVDINDRGQVLVYYSAGRFSAAAFLYSDGEVHQIGDLAGGSAAHLNFLHLNELGQVVGFSTLPEWNPSDPPGVNDHAFFYSDDDGRTTDLTRWLMNSFHDVAFVDHRLAVLELNDLGQIAISATLANGQQTLFVLTPIPEPSTYALMLSGLGVLAWIARRQRGRSMGNRVDQTHQSELVA